MRNHSHPQKSDLRPGMRVKHLKTGQYGQVANVKTNDHFSIPVIILNHHGSKTNKTRIWKVNDIELT